MRKSNISIPDHAERQMENVSNNHQKQKDCLFTGSHYDRFGYGLDKIHIIPSA